VSTKVVRPDPRGGRIGKALSEFLWLEAAGGIVLLVATVVALVLANSGAADATHDFWMSQVGIRLGSFSFVRPLEFWVNDGLMTIFFFVVGLEIKQELVVGELREPRKAALPVFAAVGGMVVPALLFLAVNAGGPGARGWGIPMATDIAFAVGVLALLTKRVPSPLRLFLLTLAIVDDVGGIIVIDFVDMEVKENRDKVVRAFKDALSRDKTRTQVFNISELGLVEMTRKRIGEGLLETVGTRCATCDGRGVIVPDDLLS
jgi:hypothetical protein